MEPSFKRHAALGSSSWSSCQSSFLSKCNPTQRANVIQGTVKQVINQSAIILNNVLNPVGYIGLHVSIVGENRTISAAGAYCSNASLPSSCSDYVMVSVPFSSTLTTGLMYYITSDYSPTQTSYTCQRVSFQCGPYSVQDGTYVPEDVNAKPSGQDVAVNQGGQITLTCNTGYIAAYAADSYGCQNPSIPCNTSSKQYTRTCAGCQWYSSKTCKRIACKFSPALTEYTSWTSPLLYGNVATVHCKSGYRAAPIPQGSRGVSPANPTSYNVTCGSPSNEFQYQKSVPAGCNPVACPAFAQPPNSQSDLLYSEYTPADPTIKITCSPGYRRSDSLSSFYHPCKSVFYAKCVDGKFVYLDTNETQNAQVLYNVSCVPMNCGGSNDVCGSETCAPSSQAGEIPQSTAIPNGGSQIVQCKAGYRAATLSTAAQAVCNSPRNFTRACRWCNFDPNSQLSCRPIQCQASNLLDAYGYVSNIAYSYNKSITVFCKKGHRTSSNTYSLVNDSISYKAACLDDCGIKSTTTGISCKPVQCPVPNVANANASFSGPVTYGQIVNWTCLPGYRLTGSQSTYLSPCKSVVEARCFEGYLLFSSHGAFVSRQVPSCEPIVGCGMTNDTCGMETCPSPQNLSKNVIETGLSYVASGASVTLQCKEGYRASSMYSQFSSCVEPANFTLSCRYCNFQNVTTSCKPFRCWWSQSSDPNGKLVNASSFATYSSTLMIQCNHGYRAAARSSSSSLLSDPMYYHVRCGADCSLVAAQQCKPVRCNAPSIANLQPTSLQLVHNRSSTLSCANGFQNNLTKNSVCNPQTFQAMCLNGQLQYYSKAGMSYQASVSCIPQYCPAFQVADQNLNVSFGVTFPVRVSTATGYARIAARCRSGYRFGTSDIRSPNEANLVCSNCVWNTTSLPTCQTAQCPLINISALPNLYQVYNLQMSYVNTLQVAYGNNVTVECKPGYAFVNQSTVSKGILRCTDSGYYPPVSHLCQPILCKTFSPPKHSSSNSNSYVFGQQASYTCQSSYHVWNGTCAQTTGNVSCFADGTWPQIPDCAIVDGNKSCLYQDMFGSPSFTGSNSFTGSRRISCQSGYAAVDVSQQYADCSSASSSSYSITCSDCQAVSTKHCAPLACKLNLSNTPGLSSSGVQYISYGQTRFLTCQAGYRADSKGNNPLCNRNLCSPAASKSVALTCSANNCPLSSSSSFCNKVSCGLFQKLNNTSYDSSVRNKVYYYGDQVAFTCATGYRVESSQSCSNNGVAMCQDDGKFSAPRCIPVTCPVPLSYGTSYLPSSGMVPYQSSVTIQCAKGYNVLDSSKSLTPVCNASCQFENAATCVVSACDATKGLNISFANAKFNPVLVPLLDTIKITCYPGFIVSGPLYSKCINVFYPQCLPSRQFSLVNDLKCVAASCPPPATDPSLLSLTLSNASLDFSHVKLPNGSIVPHDSNTPVAYGSSLLVTCSEGFVAQPLQCSCQQTNQARTSSRRARRELRALPQPTSTSSCSCSSSSSNSYPITCGSSSQPCSWGARLYKCVRKNSCGPLRAWPDSLVTSSSNGDTAYGVCGAGKLPFNAAPSSCSKEWSVTCKWNSTQWVWMYTGTSIPYDSQGPCSKNVSCSAQALGTIFKNDAMQVVSRVHYGEYVQSSCSMGYTSQNGAARSSKCTDSCSLSPAPVQCTSITCNDLLDVFDFTTANSQGINLDSTYGLGDTVQVTCPAGYVLDTVQSSSAGIQLQTGPLSVIASKVFPPPNRSRITTYYLASSSNLTITFPPNAWPAGENRPVKINLVNFSSNLVVTDSALSASRKIAGQGIYFEPSGIVFALPVAISIPFDTHVDYGNFRLNVFVFNTTTNSWTAKPYSSSTSVPVNFVEGVVHAQTSSFSLYTVLATPLGSTVAITNSSNMSYNENMSSIMTTTPAPTAAPSSKSLQQSSSANPTVTIVIVLSVLVAVAMMVVFFMDYRQGQKKKEQEQELEAKKREQERKARLQDRPRPTQTSGVKTTTTTTTATTTTTTTTTSGGGVYQAETRQTTPQAQAPPSNVEAAKESKQDVEISVAKSGGALSSEPAASKPKDQAKEDVEAEEREEEKPPISFSSRGQEAAAQGRADEHDESSQQEQEKAPDEPRTPDSEAGERAMQVCEEGACGGREV
eukprot:767971-Hanusia_phi.AAC.4